MRRNYRFYRAQGTYPSYPRVANIKKYASNHMNNQEYTRCCVVPEAFDPFGTQKSDYLNTKLHTKLKTMP